MCQGNKGDITMAKKKEKRVFAKERDRKWALELYPDNENHMKVLEYLKKADEYQIAYILHDKDVYEDDSEEHKEGDLKKPHYHVYCRLRKIDGKPVNARYTRSFCKEIGYQLELDKENTPYARFVLPCTNEKGFMRYLVHKDNPQKYQYDVEEVQGELKHNVAILVGKSEDSEEEKAMGIIELIESYDGYINIMDFTKKTLENGLYDTFSRKYVLFRDCIKQHNDSIKVKRSEALMNTTEDVQYIETERGSFRSFESIYEYMNTHDMDTIKVLKWHKNDSVMNLQQEMNKADVYEFCFEFQ